MTSHSPGTLFCVATPIGNMGDITLRALETFEQVSAVACEDTRETKKLFEYHGVEQTELIAYHAQSPNRVEDGLIERLLNGDSIALVSDRGTPTISDPGSRLIERAVHAGIPVVPIPGASSLLACVQAAGVPLHQFVFLGFLPHKKGRQTLLEEVSAAKRSYVFFESPHRIVKTLTALQESEKTIVIGRELTKLHEEFLRGTAAELLQELESRPAIKGEFVVIVSAK